MPPVPVRTRLKTSTAVRRLLGRRVALARACAKGERLWRRGHGRERAVSAMAAILAGTGRSGEVQELARRRLIEDEASRALFWGPWRTSEIGERSGRHLDEAFSSGRRVILSMCHLGPFFLALSPMGARGIRTIAVSGPWMFAEPTPDHWGRRLARWRRGVADRGGRLVHSGDSFEVLRALVERGEALVIYFDLPGSIRTDFLGKPVMLAAGTAQLAHQTDALVLPLRARREGTRVWTDTWEALDPRDFSGPQELHRAVAAVHERSILEMPEALEDPRRPGAWEDGARPGEWALPSRT
jgi:lauroyl/myristoyl acyltransferase